VRHWRHSIFCAILGLVDITILADVIQVESLLPWRNQMQCWWQD